MLRCVSFIIGLLFMSGVYAQRQYSCFTIQNYQQSTVLTLEQQHTSKVVLDTYGKTIRMTKPSNFRINYLFNGQELDKELNLYFYPSRIYSIATKRFFQVDPLTQYFSPYCFVGGDPVNYIDKTGNAGKPIVFHGLDYRVPGNEEISLMQLKAQVGDAYYIPLADLYNGNVSGDFSEFNGNVYIDSHMSKSGFVTLERSDIKDKLKATNAQILEQQEASPRFEGVERSRVLGSRLRRMAEDKNLEVKNIVAGGCQGEVAAKQIGEGFTDYPSGAVSRRVLNTHGLSTDFDSYSFGDVLAAHEGYEKMGETRLFAIPHNSVNIHARATEETEMDERPKFGTMAYKEDEEVLFSQEAEKYATGQEYSDLVREARIPKSLNAEYKSFSFEY